MHPWLKHVREAPKRLTVTWKELQGFPTHTNCVLHVTAISYILLVSGLKSRRKHPDLAKISQNILRVKFDTKTTQNRRHTESKV